MCERECVSASAKRARSASVRVLANEKQREAKQMARQEGGASEKRVSACASGECMCKRRVYGGGEGKKLGEEDVVVFVGAVVGLFFLNCGGVVCGAVGRGRG